MRKADNLPPYRAVVMKSGSLDFVDPSGPAQACYGRALLLLLLLFVITCIKSIYNYIPETNHVSMFNTVSAVL